MPQFVVGLPHPQRLSGVEHVHAESKSESLELTVAHVLDTFDVSE